MATRKRLTPIQKAYQQQVKRISKELTELRKLGRPVNQLEKELRQLASKRPTSKGVQKLKEEYSKRKLEHKAGVIREGKKLTTKEQYEAKREQRWEKQRQQYEQKKQAKKQRQIQKTKNYWDEHLPEIITTKTQQPATEGEPPKVADLVLDRVLGMIGDATIATPQGVERSKGTQILHDMLKNEINKYGRNAVAGAMEQLPKEAIEEMETVIRYEQTKEQNSKTIRKIAEAITSEILSPSVRKEIANSADAEEEYG